MLSWFSKGRCSRPVSVDAIIQLWCTNFDFLPNILYWERQVVVRVTCPDLFWWPEEKGQPPISSSTFLIFKNFTHLSNLWLNIH
jgi:hypothetical protein